MCLHAVCWCGCCGGWRCNGWEGRLASAEFDKPVTKIAKVVRDANGGMPAANAMACHPSYSGVCPVCFVGMGFVRWLLVRSQVGHLVM